ncbi:MAG: TetR/AcrR family transcriptional regulator [Chloroflexi bacterium]|nr:TetR/AcrR family transcriptional regulator [Chloroflexota bacterium]
MPKDTFLNLPEKKRLLIEEAAIDEFATWGFDNASINRIVAQCQIAKGSFYQYFEDKKDLFKHLFTRTGERKIEYLSPILHNPEAYDFFTLLAELYRSGLAFAKENPKSAIIGNRVYRNKEHLVYQEIFSDGMDTAKAFYENLLNIAIANGEIRTDMNPRFIVHILQSLSITIFDYYFEEVKGNDFNMTKVEDDVMDTVNMTLDFIKNGITAKTKELAI